ncbi:Retrotransposon Gag-like protein 3 [Bienertia sinuspersici]
MVDIRKPLRRGMKVATNPNSSKWVDVKYERLGDFCYYCGKLGHIGRDCEEVSAESDEVREMVYKYGPWMRASSLRRNKVSKEEWDKEKIMLEKLTKQKVNYGGNMHELTVTKLGPPSLARRALFPEGHKHVNEVDKGKQNIDLSDHCSSTEEENRGESTNIIRGLNLQEGGDVENSANANKKECEGGKNGGIWRTSGGRRKRVPRVENKFDNMRDKMAVHSGSREGGIKRRLVDDLGNDKDEGGEEDGVKKLKSYATPLETDEPVEVAGIGLANRDTISSLQELCWRDRPNIVFVMETMIEDKKLERVRRKCRYENGVCLSSNGNSGGLGLWWRDMEVQVESYSTHHIEENVLDAAKNPVWKAIGFYGWADAANKNLS